MTPVRRALGAIPIVYRTYGARGIRLRAVHELRRALQRFRAVPRFKVEVQTESSAAHFKVDAAALAAACDRTTALGRADAVVQGKYEAFRWDWRPLPATAAEWLRDPFSGQPRAANGPWWETAHLAPGVGDIKDVWEPARFAWAYDLVRGWLITGDERYAVAFWENFERWSASSPAFNGPHWSCGQETAIRATALLYAQANLANAAATTPTRTKHLTSVLAASGERIADALGYAVSQRNNHAISEATGLVVLGVRLHGEHPEADGWLERGRRMLESLVREQFAADGWYIQHSFTYQRLALDQLVVAERALRAHGERLSAQAVARILASADLLGAVIDPASGIAPNYGANDGAFVHPITLAAYRDFRPVLTAIAALWDHALPADVAIDREVLAWLGASAPAAGPSTGEGVQTGESGWAVVRLGKFTVFMRAGRYHSRPGHLDPLHIDVRVNGREIIVDPGTYAYNAPAPWRNGLASGHVHNGPVVDGEEPARSGPRFLWYSWPQAEIVSAQLTAGVATVVAEMPGRARRTVRVRAGQMDITDELLDPGARRLSVAWTLHPDADPAAISTEPVSTIVAAEAEGVRGWFSPHYGQRLPTARVLVSTEGGLPAVTHILS